MNRRAKSRVIIDPDKLKQIMWAKRMTWSDLAKMTGQTRQNLYYKKRNVEEGHYSNQKTLFQIADALGVEPEEIAERIG